MYLQNNFIVSTVCIDKRDTALSKIPAWPYKKKTLWNNKIKRCHKMEGSIVLFDFTHQHVTDWEEVDVSEDNVTPVGQKSHLICMSCIGFPATICFFNSQKASLKENSCFPNLDKIKWDKRYTKLNLRHCGLWRLSETTVNVLPPNYSKQIGKRQLLFSCKTFKNWSI